MNPKKPFCRDCGVEKNDQTTSRVWTADGRDKWCHLCKKCYAKHRKIRRLTLQDVGYLRSLLQRHLDNAEVVRAAIELKGD